jgi:hypothetical protein
MSDIAPDDKASASMSMDCAIIVDGSVIASGEALGIEGTKIKARLVLSAAPGQAPWIGIVLNIPFADPRQTDNQKSGFGVRYFCRFLLLLPLNATAFRRPDQIKTTRRPSRTTCRRTTRSAFGFPVADTPRRSLKLTRPLSQSSQMPKTSSA